MFVSRFFYSSSVCQCNYKYYISIHLFNTPRECSSGLMQSSISTNVELHLQSKHNSFRVCQSIWDRQRFSLSLSFNNIHSGHVIRFPDDLCSVCLCTFFQKNCHHSSVLIVVIKK